MCDQCASLFFFLSPGKTLEGLDAGNVTQTYFLDMSVHGGFWCTPTSAQSLWTRPMFLNCLSLTIFLRRQSSLSLVHLFLQQFSLPVNFSWIWCLIHHSMNCQLMSALASASGQLTTQQSFSSVPIVIRIQDWDILIFHFLKRNNELPWYSHILRCCMSLC